MLIRFFKLYIGKILCFLHMHKWIVVDWVYKKGKGLNCDIKTRKDKCKRCLKQRIKKDPLAEQKAKEEKIFKLNLWKESRRVIVEKHRNPKRYTFQVRFKDDKIPFFKKEKMISDEDVEEIRMKVLNNIRFREMEGVVFEMIDMDAKQPPEELL